MREEITKKDGINDLLFDRVVSILEHARANIVRSVNHNMVIAYWLIGREIVEEVQKGEKRADYGKQIVDNLSKMLNERYDKGFSVTSLQYFRKFYLSYSERLRTIPRPLGVELKKQHPSGVELNKGLIHHPMGGEFEENQFGETIEGFSSELSWSHYRALMRVANIEARDFYEKEAVECGWTKLQLERQIHTSYYERILGNKGKEGLLPANRERLAGETTNAIDIIKSPFVLEFLDLPDMPSMRENDIEQLIIRNLQSFLLELGKGFSFVARQKHIRFDDDDFYLDLVFYNIILKCYVLIDLKIGKLTHADIGQMDGYVRLFEDKFRVEGDNPTIGLILCSDKSETVARYSVLSEYKQIFASKYLKYLPSEEELKNEIEKERRLIESYKNELEER